MIARWGFCALIMSATSMACGGGGTAGTTTSAASTGASGGTSASARSTASAAPEKPKRGASASEAGRQGSCKFVAFEGEGKERAAMFKIEAPVPAGKQLSHVQAWVFYYDREGKYLSRYPHSTSVSDKPQALGSKGDDIPKGTETLECELSAIWYKGDTAWFNENLVPNFEQRPKGGFPESFLTEHAGEKVEVEVVDAKAGKVRLKNVSDKEVKSARATLLFYKDTTYQHDSRDETFDDLALKPGATVDKQIKLDSPEKLPAAPSSVEGVAPEVTFADGSRFRNDNLASSWRGPGG